MRAAASSRVSVGSVPVRTKVMPRKRSSVTVSVLAKLTPASRRRRIWCCDCSSENHLRMKSAVTAPMSGMDCSSSSPAAISSSSVPKCCASTLPALEPTWRMPKAQSSRARPALLLRSMAFIRFSADFLPMRSSLAMSPARR